jgi:hypothetical protein
VDHGRDLRGADRSTAAVVSERLEIKLTYPPDEDALSNALDKYGSWHEIVNTGLTVDRRGEKRPVVAVVDLASLLALLRAREGGAE